MVRIERSIEEKHFWRAGGRRSRLECRECEVICERVVSPWHCLKSSCRYIYVFEGGGSRYFGCLNKVFAPELDLALFEQALSAGGRRGDPFGSLKAIRPPRPECRVAIEQAYPAAVDGMCHNPTFFHCPLASERGGIRLTAGRGGRRDSGGQG